MPLKVLINRIFSSDIKLWSQNDNNQNERVAEDFSRYELHKSQNQFTFLKKRLQTS